MIGGPGRDRVQRTTNKSFLNTAIEVGAAAASVYALKIVLQRAGRRKENEGIAAGKRVVILGGGFAGTGVAQELARLLPDRENGEILLLSEDNYMLFTPMLTEAAGGELEASHIVSPLRSLEPRIRFVQGRVTSIDLGRREVDLQVGAGSPGNGTERFTGDHLVIALGSVSNSHGITGVDAHCLGMKTLADARNIFQRISACLERATTETDAAKRAAWMTFVVAGGGFTGVETMAAINDFLRESVRLLPALKGSELRTVLVTPEARLLPELSEELATYAAGQLQHHGVELQFNASVSEMTEDAVELKGGERIVARTVIWAAGVTPSPLIEPLPAAKGKHHGLQVNTACQVDGYPGVWALGDCAEIPQPDGKGTYAPTAQNATREGKQVARNLVAAFHGQQSKPFRYKPMGELALVGRHTGVARVFGMNFSGLLAWAMWRAVYLAKMPGAAQRTRVLSDWILDSVFRHVPVPLSSGQPAQQAEKH